MEEIPDCAPTVDISPEAKEWAQRKLNEDRDFIQNRAQFGSPIVKNIAALILKIGERG